MSFLKLATRRISVRGYTNDPVRPEDLEHVLEAGRMAPSAANRQPWHFLVLRDPDARAALRPAYEREWFIRAPVIIVVCVEPSKAWVRSDGINYAWVDAAIAMDHMTLSAADLGLGTCWIGAFQAPKLREILRLPDGIEPVAMTPLGTPADGGRPKTRKTLAEIAHWDRW